MGEFNINNKITYQKPQALDLGPVAPIIGASCGVGNTFSDDGICTTGNSYINLDGGPSHKEDKIDSNLFD